MPIRNPTFADVLLAFRQAKRANASERGAVGLFDLARFEARLAKNIRLLRSSLTNDGWFDKITIGRLVVMPRSNAPSVSERPDIIRVGVPSPPATRAVDVRLQLEPSPQFTTIEVLYLWEFGGALEALLDDCCLGYRLKRVGKEGRMDRESRDVYEHWPTTFARYRNEPIRSARDALRDGRRVIVTNTDVAAFFDSIDPSFLTRDGFVADLEGAAIRAGRSFTPERYQIATQSLLRRYGEFRELRRSVGGADIDTETGIPIGALTSRVFANIALSSVDVYIQSQPDVVLYRRYVDDMVVVSAISATRPGPSSRREALERHFPGFVHHDNVSQFTVPSTGAVFELNEGKTLVHELLGEPGEEFLGAVQQAFSVVTSEKRAFFGDIEKLGAEIEVVDLFSEGAGQNDGVPRLRDADRFTLRRLLASEVVRGLERCALLVSAEEASALLERRASRMLSAIDGDIELDDFEFALSLLRVALFCGSEPVVERVAEWLRQRCDISRMQRVEEIVWRGRRLLRKPAITRLAHYLERRIREVIASSCSLSEPRLPIEDRRTAALAMLLRRADLRHLDREDDVRVFGASNGEFPGPVRREYAETASRMKSDRILDGMLRHVRLFLERSKDLGEQTWKGVPEVALLLSTKPPQYADVARRFLGKAESEPIPEDVGTMIDGCVDALRGTRYRRRELPAVDVVHAEGRIGFRVGGPAHVDSVRVILANLPVPLPAFKAAALGHPLLTVHRLKELDAALRSARKAARFAKAGGSSAILVLPELAIPRRWMRHLYDYAAREELGVVAGLEYRSVPPDVVLNQAIGIFPAGMQAAAIISWTKGNPARGEEEELRGVRKRLARITPPLQVVDTIYGRLSVLICSEIMEAPALSALRGEVELILVPAWNKDTGSFEYMGHAAAGLLVHAFVCVANNAEASDSRIIAPIREPRHEREWCRLVHRGENQIIWGDLPVAELRRFHGGVVPPKPREYRPLPPGWKTL